MNNDSPYDIELNAREHKSVTVETYIDVSEMENPIQGGSAQSMNIIIEDDDGKNRRL
ncbi:hypothetical protein J2Z83_002234 [Virgibacillus natechei]|uniref:Uncharacterized protein n=1 Tax=Virgibacillus natechei TaxID=1216297 RepID=A0ABS4IGX1_9BACI|nr:hypothetical protein [Virgibacillus natechei]MBP1970118.1 hypothetical protein [Virgibacillus natechei]UZD14195.1 hypothetical protein OLD84_06670 [Virgibacillus natechei]